MTLKDMLTSILRAHMRSDYWPATTNQWEWWSKEEGKEFIVVYSNG